MYVKEGVVMKETAGPMQFQSALERSEDAANCALPELIPFPGCKLR